MPDQHAAAWARAIRQRTDTRGITLSTEAMEELLAHLEDLYDSTRRTGGSDRDALDAARRGHHAAG